MVGAHHAAEVSTQQHSLYVQPGFMPNQFSLRHHWPGITPDERTYLQPRSYYRASVQPSPHTAAMSPF